MWWTYALLSAVFAALTAVLAKVGIKGVSSDLATAISTVVILMVAWGIVFVRDNRRRHGHLLRWPLPGALCL